MGEGFEMGKTSSRHIQDKAMRLSDFLDRLVSAIESAPFSEEITNEKEFEKLFLIPVIREVSTQHPGVRTYTHPWGSKTRCTPDCDTAPNRGRIVPGCPRCWATSKKWASVLAFGTRHTFDAVAKDTFGKTLAVEAKFIDSRGHSTPSGEIQRLLGQCALAKTKHDFVLGVCGYTGDLEQEGKADTEWVRDWFQRAGIQLVFRSFA